MFHFWYRILESQQYFMFISHFELSYTHSSCFTVVCGLQLQYWNTGPFQDLFFTSTLCKYLYQCLLREFFFLFASRTPLPLAFEYVFSSITSFCTIVYFLITYHLFMIALSYANSIQIIIGLPFVHVKQTKEKLINKAYYPCAQIVASHDLGSLPLPVGIQFTRICSHP